MFKIVNNIFFQLINRRFEHFECVLINSMLLFQQIASTKSNILRILQTNVRFENVEGVCWKRGKVADGICGLRRPSTSCENLHCDVQRRLHLIKILPLKSEQYNKKYNSKFHCVLLWF